MKDTFFAQIEKWNGDLLVSNKFTVSRTIGGLFRSRETVTHAMAHDYVVREAEFETEAAAIATCDRWFGEAANA